MTRVIVLHLPVVEMQAMMLHMALMLVENLERVCMPCTVINTTRMSSITKNITAAAA